MKRTPPPPTMPAQRSGFVPLRGASGKVWGLLDPQTMVIEFKHGNLVDRVDLTQYRSEPNTKS